VTSAQEMKRDGEEGTPVDTPLVEGERNGQDDNNRTAEDVSTAASEVREDGERKWFLLL